VDIKKIEKKVKSKEKLIHDHLLQPNFFQNLEDEAEKLVNDPSCSGFIKVVEAKMQADLICNDLALKQKVDACVVSDTDFVVVTGPSMMLIKDFKLGKSGKKSKVHRVAHLLLLTRSYNVLFNAIVSKLHLSEAQIK
jgi:hypothetical protein